MNPGVAQEPSPVSKTRFGLPIDYGFAVPASERRLQLAARALRENGFTVELVDTPEQARAYVNSILPEGQPVFTASSEMIRLSGLDEDINKSGKYQSLRQQLTKMDRKT